MATRKRSSRDGDGGGTVDAYMAKLEHPHKEGVEALRRAILSLDDRIGEEVKWNAPSYRLGDHFATFRLHPVPTFQLVLHTGARSKAAPRQFEIDDPGRLLKWAAKDRCSISFDSSADALAKREALITIVRAWIRQL